MTEGIRLLLVFLGNNRLQGFKCHLLIKMPSVGQYLPNLFTYYKST